MICLVAWRSRSDILFRDANLLNIKAKFNIIVLCDRSLGQHFVENSLQNKNLTTCFECRLHLEECSSWCAIDSLHPRNG